MGWVTVEGENDSKDVVLYSLSYCHACDKAKRYLKEKDVEFRYLDIDKAEPENRQEAAGVFGNDLPSSGMSIAFPILVINRDIRVVGFDREKIADALDLTKEKEEEA